MGNKLEIKKSLAKRPEGFECHGLKYPPTFSAAAAGARTGRDAAERRRNRKRMSVSTSGDEWLNFRHPIDNIVLSGGGSKGYAFVGALKVRHSLGQACFAKQMRLAEGPTQGRRPWPADLNTGRLLFVLRFAPMD